MCAAHPCRYIYKHLARVEPGTLLDPTAIAWCLTVPAMWNDEAKAKMRQAANRAGEQDAVWYGRIRCGMVLHGTVRHGMILVITNIFITYNRSVTIWESPFFMRVGACRWSPPWPGMVINLSYSGERRSVRRSVRSFLLWGTCSGHVTGTAKARGSSSRDGSVAPCHPPASYPVVVFPNEVNKQAQRTQSEDLAPGPWLHRVRSFFQDMLLCRLVTTSCNACSVDIAVQVFRLREGRLLRCCF